MVTITIKENSKQAKAIIEMLKAFPFVEIHENPRYNAETEQALKDFRAGKLKTTKVTLEDFRKEIYS
jgi:hypothetical protein